MSINRDLSKAIAAAVRDGTITSSGTLDVPSGVTSYAYDSAGALLATDSSGYDDGSLHYLSKLREMYVWDDSDGGFFKVDELSESKLAGPQPPNHQGSSYGYMAGGRGSPTTSNVIDKFTLTSDGNATDVGDLVNSRFGAMGFSSPDHGYTAGGTMPGYTTSIERWAFASDGNSAFHTSIGGTSVDGRGGSASTFSGSHGYMMGGTTPSRVNAIEKFSFSTSSGNLDVGDLLYVMAQSTGNMSSTHGYTSGGRADNAPTTYINVIQKFPFAADGDTTDVGDILHQTRGAAGSSSATHGYTSGGWADNGGRYDYNVIQKFPFASDGNATDVGDLPEGLQGMPTTSVSSTESGYNVGGTNITQPTTVPYGNSGSPIKKYSFSSDGNSTEVGDLTLLRSEGICAHV